MGTKTTAAEGTTSTDGKDQPPVFTPMNWSLEEVRASIPPHLFQPSLLRSASYLVRDLLLTSGLVAMAYFADKELRRREAFEDNTENMRKAFIAARWAMWAFYWNVQALVMTGLWLIAHELGHGSLTPYQKLNDAIGFVIHSALLTPYYSWKISHHTHHVNNSSMENDVLWVPHLRSDWKGLPKEGTPEEYEEYFSDSPLYSLIQLISVHFFAYQAYLALDLSGNPDMSKEAWTSHYSPYSPLFKEGQRSLIFMSDLGLGAMFYFLSRFSFKTMAMYYGVPWFLLSHWLVVITYLHHADPRTPHYRKEARNFVRGAAATMDRDMLGFIGTFFFHGTNNWHIVHHFFPRIPFYHAEEATKYIKEFMGPYYNYSSENAILAFINNRISRCKYVDDEGPVVFFKDRRGQAVFRVDQDVGKPKKE